MVRRILVVGAALVALTALNPATDSQAQAPAAPAPHAALLKKAAGTWDATVHDGTTATKGTETIRLIGDGMWVVSDFEGEMAGAPYRGHGVSGYDAVKKKHVGVWVDTTSPFAMHMEGEFDAGGKVLTSHGTMTEPSSPSGKLQFTLVEKWIDDDNRDFTISMAGPDGKLMQMMKITYKRRK